MKNVNIHRVVIKHLNIGNQFSIFAIFHQNYNFKSLKMYDFLLNIIIIHLD